MKRLFSSYIKLCVLCFFVFNLTYPATAFSLPQTENAEFIQILDSAEQRLELAIERQQLAESKLKHVVESKQRLRKQMSWQRDELSTTEGAFTRDYIIEEKLLRDAELSLAIAQADYESIKITNVEAIQTIDNIQATIRSLGDQLQEVTLSPLSTEDLKQQIKGLRERLDFQQTLLSIEQNRLKNLVKTKEVLRDRLKNEEQWSAELKRGYQIQEEQKHILQMRSLEGKLQNEQKQLLQELAKLNQKQRKLEKQVVDQVPSAQTNQLQIAIFQAEEKSNVIQTKMMLVKFSEQAQSLNKVLDSRSSTLLRSVNRQALNLASDLEKLDNLHERKLAVLKLRKKITQEQKERGESKLDDSSSNEAIIAELIQKYTEQRKEVGMVLVKVKQYQKQIESNLTKALARRQGFPEMTLNAWRVMGSKLSRIPGLTSQAFTGLNEQFKISWQSLSQWNLILLIIIECFWLATWIEGRGILAKFTRALHRKRSTLSGETVYVLIKLLRENWFGIILAIMLFTLLFVGGVPFKSFSFLAYLVLVWFVAKMSIGFARITLLEGAEQISGHDVKLYHGMKWFCITGGLLAALTVLTHQLPVGYHVTDLFNRISMVYVFVFALFLFSKRNVVPTLLSPYVEGERRYLGKVIRSLSWMIPLTMLINACIGLFGYVALAWSVAKHAMLFLLILTGYMLVHGLFIDAMELLSRFCIRHLKNGWLWSESLLKPIDRVLRIMLFFVAIWGLFIVYGWDERSVVVQSLIKSLHFQIFKIDNIWWTLFDIIEAVIIVATIFWAARWSREFAYRWLFANKRDIGIRNSLSAFFQYTVVVIGFYIGYQALPIEKGGLLWILTGLFIGIGFGLRDIAKSFVSGILLLIERPIRRGDIITIDGHDGEVTHIGMRAMTVHTWDHMDVLVPNSEIFTKTFKNWTRQDNVVRSVVTIKVHRADNPHEVSDYIYEILDQNEDVLKEPEPRILLREISDDLLDLEVRYYVHLDIPYTRVRVRSDVLFSIWQKLKEKGIRAPYPQHDVHMASS